MKRKLFIGLAIALGAMIAINSCKKDKGVENIPATGVELNKPTLTISVGDEVKLVANVLPADATDKRVTWESSDENVATVSATGAVTGVKDGTAKITVYTEDGDFSASCNVTVGEGSPDKPDPDKPEPDKPEPDKPEVPTEVLELSKSAATIGVEETLCIAPYVKKNYPDLWDKVKFTSDDANIATVDENMVITGVAEGSATLTGTCEVDGKTYSATFEVKVENTFVTFVEDIMTITNRGVVVTSKITDGTVRTDDKVKMIQPSDSYKNYNLTIGQLEMFRKIVEWAGKNDNVGIMFSESPKLKKSDITRGALIMGEKTERVVAVKKVYGTLALNDSRKTPIFPGFTPQLFSGKIDHWVTLSDLAGEDNLMPKATYDNIGFTAKEGNKLICYLGMQMELRESGRTIGTFTVTDYEEVDITYENVN